MFSAFVDRVRNETEVGVPRRFSVGALFVLLTLYAILARVVVLLGGDAMWTGVICLFFAAITLGQILLFRGVRPRAASVVVGAATCPLLLIVFVIDESFTNLTGWAPLASGLNRMDALSSALALLTLGGMGFGYVAGGMMASAFYFLGKLLPATMIENVAGSAVGTHETLSEKWARLIGRWVNPCQPSRPLNGAMAIFLISVVFCYFYSTFVGRFSLQHFMTFGATIGACLAFWTGNFQLWISWPMVLMAVGIAVAAWPANALAELPAHRMFIDQEPPILLGMMRTAGGMLGLTLSALVGWAQWSYQRRQPQFRWGLYSLAGCALVLIAASLLATQQLRMWSRWPMQQLQRKIIDSGGDLEWNGTSLHGVSLKSLGDDAFMAVRPLCQNAARVSLFGPKITNASTQALQGLHLSWFTLQQTTVTDDAFQGVTDFSAIYVWINDNQVGDAFLADMVAPKRMQRGLRSLTLNGTKVTDEGLVKLHDCRALDELVLLSCQITDEGLSDLAGIKRLTTLQLMSCPITDDGLRKLAKASPSLVHCSLDGTHVTAEGVEWFKKTLPNCTVRWEPVPTKN